jgi:GTP-binding protein Era
MAFKAGFVNIIGAPNVGKSTLMNALLEQKLCITNPKAQTTRHRIMGFMSGDDYQVVFSDTPGVLDPAYKLHESMMSVVAEALEDADLLLFITDIYQPYMPEVYLETLRNTTVPVLLLINKMDEVKEPDALEALIQQWHERIPNARIAPISALHGMNVDMLRQEIVNLLPEHPPYFDPEELTDRPVRFFVAEIIREKILHYYNKEVPYSCEVDIESYKEEPAIDRIYAVIYVARESQKPIIIGKGGAMLKRVGTAARKDIEAFVGKQVFLDLRVKVRENWRNNERMLKRFGY